MGFFSNSRYTESEKEYDTSVSDVEDRHAQQNAPDKRNKSLSSSSKNNQEPKFCTPCKCLVASILVIIGLAVAASLIFTNSANPLDYFIPVDPPGAKEATRWDATQGLRLQVDIATNDLWTPIVEQTILDWNQSEGVILTMNSVAFDPECRPKNGRLKVCNDDYGETPWHGINIILQDKDTNLTIHSISKLNDRYNQDTASKIYISCHENGHGLGLPHTDEDHFNRDRGDCMDYTIRPERNGVPGDYNLNLLVDLYGTPDVPRGSNTVNPEGATDNASSSSWWDNNDPSGSTLFPPSNNNREDNEEEEEDEDDRRRRHLYLRHDDRILSTLDDDDVDAFEKKVSMECQTEYCIYPYGKNHYVKINQFLKAPSKEEMEQMACV